MFIENDTFFYVKQSTKLILFEDNIQSILIQVSPFFVCILAPIEPPVEVTVTRKSDHAVSVWWRGVSTTNVEEPLEGYKVSGYCLLNL